MASIASLVGAGVSFGKSPAPATATIANCHGHGGVRIGIHQSRRMVMVRAEGGINPEIRKTEAKVVDSVVVTDLEKPLTAYCRCWRSGTFPLCDGSHVKHNKATGDNVGPLLLKKQ